MENEVGKPVVHDESALVRSKVELETHEIDWFLDAVWVRYGYDFRQYARASLIRRVHYRLQSEGLKRVSELIPLVLYDEDFFQRFLKDMSVTVTTMFRNAVVFKGIRDQIVSFLRTYPRINIWHAGCATGEEVYSMAILLKEEGLLERTRIYATDYNNQSLEFAKHGIYPLKEIRGYTENYLCAGGKGSFSDYYQARYEHAIMNSDLKDRITFAHHNLMKDGVFAEMHLVLCRNVLIYFDQNLQNRVLKVLSNSLVHRGFLVLGDKETLDFSAIANEFDEQVDRQRIYRKRPVLNSIT